ncbi:hypothetical protein RRG08_061076 [Elysia crispata]|uniref:Uncharacterized protein n=1 Tax=Elysia crispata TaxID=231223 RepID=A0AAE0YW06_9GAST|nr:hypothetical protein RRG08_061076 [Elysia crispata]
MLRTLVFVFQLLVLLPLCLASSSRPRRNDETVFLNPAVRETFRPFILMDADLADDRVTPWPESQGEDSLPEFRRACPSSLFMRFNANRIPAITFEKHCDQQQCSALGDSPAAPQTMHNLLEDYITPAPMCRPIAYYRWVRVMSLRADGTRRTRHRLLEIPVGCSCSADPLNV